MRLWINLITILITILGLSISVKGESLDNSSIFAGTVPIDIYTASYRIGMWQSDHEVRKYRGDDGKQIYLIGLNRKDNKERCYLMINQENLPGYLIFLNKLGKEFEEFVSKPDNLNTYSNISAALMDMKSNKEEFVVINDELIPVRLCPYIWRHPFISNYGTPSVSVFYHLGESFYSESFFITDDGEIIQNFDDRESLKGLADILRSSMLSNEKTLNPDMYKRLGVYDEPSILSSYPAHRREILGFGSDKNARFYIQGHDNYIDGETFSSFIWLKKSDSAVLLKWLKDLNRQFTKLYKKGPRKNTGNEVIEYKIPNDLKLGGWLVGNFDVEMTIVEGHAFSPETPYCAVSSYNTESGMPDVFIGFGDCFFTFQSPDELGKVIKALETK